MVTVSSNGHKLGRINFDDLQSERGYRRAAGYGQSKLANLMFTYELQRRLCSAGSPAIAVAAHPGLARTDLARYLSPVRALVPTMTEHNFLAAMLVAAIVVGAVGDVLLGYLAYRVYRKSERTEGLIAATYLEARRALEQHR